MQDEETRKQRRRRKILYARQLRKRMTKAETILWKALRDRKCAGLKFRRQVAIEWFVVDFLCIERDLVIEIDGGVHIHQQEYDRERTEALRQRRLTILHFTNAQIIHELSAVLLTIASTCGTPLSRQASGAGGERGRG
ncbi:MAG: endonuclease domain-containing protein [Candidatus Peribacteraceae bacterium]|nr:endonuclease domain-containing protein [Candidatus Peribacteraceae bacterium]MDD5742624.1 endonuclease domain-containing protein [Candidatus Peribacteraceae bacterium]